MTKQRKTPQAGSKRTGRQGKVLFVYLPDALRDQLDALAQQTRRTVTTEVQIALEEHLKKQGMWPPKP